MSPRTNLHMSPHMNVDMNVDMDVGKNGGKAVSAKSDLDALAASASMPTLQLTLGDDAFTLAPLIVLPLGTRALEANVLRHRPPRPIEIETAIEQVEDIVMPARARLPGRFDVVSADPRMARIAREALGTDAPGGVIDLEALERLFDRLAALSQGRPVSQDALPLDDGFVAGLIVLREAMPWARTRPVA